MRAIGFLAGVGSLLREAQDAGCKVVGNVESRSPYHTGRALSWDLNFPKVPLLKPSSLDVQSKDYVSSPLGWEDLDIAVGHPPCGSASTLGNSSAFAFGRTEVNRVQYHAKRAKDQGLLPLFVSLVNNYAPRSFALDNLPKILRTSAPETWWRQALPKYHLTFVTMFNWDYGTPQRRERLWVIGVRKPGKPFLLKPIKKRPRGSPVTALDAFGELSWEPWLDFPATGHVHCPPGSMLTGDYRTTVPGLNCERVIQLATGFMSIPPECAWPYTTRRGTLGVKIGRRRIAHDRRSAVLTGLPTMHHPYTGWPLTARERARLMDWPDDFHLGSTSTEWNRYSLMRLILFTGKAVPSAFPRYLIPQLLDHIGAK